VLLFRVVASMAWSNVAVTLTPGCEPVEPAVGVTEVTVGGDVL
jgi:hypothetical protein